MFSFVLIIIISDKMYVMRKEKSRIIKTVKQVMPAVVSITLSKKVTDIQKEVSALQKKRGKKMRLSIPDDKIDSKGMVQVGGGSGFIVDASGIILTNKHVISDINVTYTVTTSTENMYDAKIVASDPINDIAILSITPREKLETLKLGDSKGVELGQTVLAFGNALGLFNNTVSRGIVSGLFRSVSAKSDPSSKPQELRGLIQTDASINPGNSGGPLVDIYGNVIGINAAVVSGAENISFAIPIHAAERDLQDIKRYGHIRRPLMGVRYVTIDAFIKDKFNLPVDYGALVLKEHFFDLAVIPKSPADKAGIKEHDIILTWNKEKITATKSIPDFLENSSIGDVATLEILRGTKTFQKNLTLIERL